MKFQEETTQLNTESESKILSIQKRCQTQITSLNADFEKDKERIRNGEKAKVEKAKVEKAKVLKVLKKKAEEARLVKAKAEEAKVENERPSTWIDSR